MNGTGTVEASTVSPSEYKNIVKVTVEELPNCEGIIAKEVVAPNGVVILPAGVDITLFEASIGMITKKMSAYGITHVYLHATQQLSEQDIEDVISKIYTDSDTLISKDTAKAVIQEVDTLYHSFGEDDFKPEAITSLANVGHDLTSELLRNPSIAFSLGKVKDADQYTFIHSFNVAVISGYLANKLHPGDNDFVEKVVFGGLLHDMGKARVPNQVLNKPGALDADEFRIMQRHPTLGVTLALQGGVSDPVILSVIGGHHEKWSGKGYPKKRKGLEIPEAARIAAVADVFDALTAKRSYKDPMSARNAITLILKDAGVHFDAKVARELLVSIGLYPPGSLVALSDGRTGIVVSGGGKDLVRPIVLISGISKKNEAPAPPEFVDLKSESNLCISKYLGHGEKREIPFG